MSSPVCRATSRALLERVRRHLNAQIAQSMNSTSTWATGCCRIQIVDYLIGDGGKQSGCMICLRERGWILDGLEETGRPAIVLDPA
jgi:hypothetical protein